MNRVCIQAIPDRWRNASGVLRACRIGLVLTLMGCFLASCTHAGQNDTSATQPFNQQVAIGEKLAIIHTNDVHGSLQPERPGNQSMEGTGNGSLGMAAIAQMAKDYRASGYEVLIFDSGDASQGTSLVDVSQGTTAMEVMGLVGYQAAALGANDFHWGVAGIAELQKKAGFPLLAANAIVSSTGQPLTQDNTIIELADGTKVGVFGLVSPQAALRNNAAQTEGIEFKAEEELYAIAQAQVDYLHEEGCGLVICLGHLGNDSDYAPNRSSDVLQATSDIDLFIDGFDHAVENEHVNNALLVQAGSHLDYVGVTIVEDGVLRENLVSYTAYDGLDDATDTQVDTFAAAADDAMTQGVARTFVPFGYDTLGETLLGDVVADAFAWQAQDVFGSEAAVDGALVDLNALGVPANRDLQEIPAVQEVSVAQEDTSDADATEDISSEADANSDSETSGASDSETSDTSDSETSTNSDSEADPDPDPLPITLKDIRSVLPVDEDLVVVEVTGDQLLSALSATVADVSDGEEQFAAPQVSDISYTIDTAGQRPLVRITDVGGKGFASQDMYTLAVSARLAQAPQFASFVDATKQARYTGVFTNEALANYLEDALDCEIPADYASAEVRISVS